MLVCNVCLRAPRRTISAEIAEAVTAVDATATGNVIFAALVDDPASVGDIIDAYLGEIMLEAASANDTVTAGSAYTDAINETVTAADAPSATVTSATVTTWNPSDKSAICTLSNGNLTFQSSGGACGVRATTSRLAGKSYFEVTFTAVSPGTSTASGCGIAPGTTTLTTLWGAGAAWVQISNGHIWINNADTGTAIGALASGQTFCVAVDFTNLKIWFRINNGNWNGSSSNDPATNVGGVSIPLFSGVAAYPSGSSQGGAGAVVGTANFGATAFAQTVPSGFAAW